MTDRQMTGNEIIKALECCQREYDKNCKQCPYNKYSITGCRGELRKDTLDFINRLQAENERLKKENEILSINADTAFQDGLNEAQGLYAEQVKAEVIKEFAERLKDRIVNSPSAYPIENATLAFLNGSSHRQLEILEIIDNLVKEMVGDTE